MMWLNGAAMAAELQNSVGLVWGCKLWSIAVTELINSVGYTFCDQKSWSDGLMADEYNYCSLQVFSDPAQVLFMSFFEER